MNEEKMLGIKEVERRTGIGSTTLRRWCRDGRVEGAKQVDADYQVHPVWMIPESSLETLPDPQPLGKRSENYGQKNPTP